MPLNKGQTLADFQANVRAEVKAGKPIKQALAIAYDLKRQAKGKGGRK